MPRFPPLNGEGPDQEPVAAGVPTSELKRLMDDPEAQRLSEPFEPAFGAGFTVIVMVDETETQGPAPSGSFVVRVSTTAPEVILGV